MYHSRPSESSDNAIHSYRDLKVWKRSIELAVQCYDATKTFPPSETSGLASQIKRAGTSVAANIAEGYGRENTGSYVQFLRIAQGSLKELETHIIIASRVKLLDPAREAELLSLSEEVAKMLRSLIRSIQRTAT